MDNNQIDEQTLEYGATPNTPQVPEHDGYIFKGWDRQIEPATEEVTYTALYEKIKIPVHFIDGLDNKLIEDQSVDYGSAPIAPTVPTHEGYTFK